MRHLHLAVNSDPASLAPVRKAVEAYAADCGYDAKTVGEIGLVVNEAMANITRHAYGGAIDKPVVVEADFEENLLRVTLRDWGSGCDPSTIPSKRDPLTPGGLGLICLRRMMDEVTFSPLPDGMLLTLKRRKS